MSVKNKRNDEYSKVEHKKLIDTEMEKFLSKGGTIQKVSYVRTLSEIIDDAMDAAFAATPVNDDTGEE